MILNTGSATATLPCLAQDTTSLRARWIYREPACPFRQMYDTGGKAMNEWVGGRVT